jgi:hypothetical protein
MYDHSNFFKFALVPWNSQQQNKPQLAIIFSGTSCMGSYLDLFTLPRPLMPEGAALHCALSN